jgi:putative protein-disulfide isomerase
MVTVESHSSSIMNKTDTTREDIFISYFTDPLCAWSWAFETEWQKLKTLFGDHLHSSYHMGGLIPDWRTFNDSVNAVARPVQMGPVWMHVAELTNTKLDHSIWVRNPPSSSYPACIAFKCAELQSRQAAEVYLGLLREAAMLFGQNISKTEILLELSTSPRLVPTGFSKLKFKKDLLNGKGLEPFRRDLALAQTNHINRFPALVIRRKNKPSLLVSGYRKAEEILRIIQS